MSDDACAVFVVDDDISVREALEALFASMGWRAHCFETAAEFLAADPPAVPSCLVLDLNLPDLSGLDVQHAIAGREPLMPIIFITGHGDIPMTVNAMKAGAVEFLTKPFSEDILLDAIRSALRRSRAAMAKHAEITELRAAYHTLSKREREVMALVVRGLMNKQVGGELGISEITVKAHRGRVMQKMRVRTLADLIEVSAKLRLADEISPDPASVWRESKAPAEIDTAFLPHADSSRRQLES